MADNIDTLKTADAPKPAPKNPTNPPEIQKDLKKLAEEMKWSPEKLIEQLQKVKPVDYTQPPERQENAIALVQSQVMTLLAFSTFDMADAEFQSLTVESLREHIAKWKSSKFAEKLSKLKAPEAFDLLYQNKDTPAGKVILAQWNDIKEIAQLARDSVKRTSNIVPPTGTSPSNSPPTITLPTGPIPSAGGIWEGAKNFVSDNKTSLMIGGAALVGIYAAYKLFGGEGSKDDSKWFSGITDWKVLTVAGFATAFGLYKWGPDWIRGAFDKFKSFLLSEKPSTIPPTTIKEMSKKIVEYNNKKNSADRRSSFPDKLIQSKWGMTVAEFKDKDGFFSNVMYSVNSGVSWVTGTSGTLPNDMKQEWNDYQLLLAYTKDKAAEYKIDTTDDTKMDDVWKKIIEKEGGSPTQGTK
jgi:hypothetical protein